MAENRELQVLRGRIAAKLQAVAAEIRAYPYPIPACDAQYNHLLERRRALAEELARLDRDMAAAPVTE